MLGFTKKMSDEHAWLVLRLALSGFLAAHGWARLIAGGVLPFGEWLGTQGLPGGAIIAGAVTGIEILGTILFALGIWVFPLSLLFASIYLVGAWMVHLPVGWFVVGLGRNGVEYSVLLIVCLLLVGFRHPKK